MADLSDVVKSLKTVDDTLKEPAKKSASDVERENEAARDAKASKEIQQDILATLKAGVGGAAQADKKSGGLIAGLLGGIGAGIGSIGKAVSKIGPKFIVGMASIAAGIGAFMLALGGIGKIAELAGIDGDGLKNLVGSTIGAFGATDLIVLAAVFAAAMVLQTKGVSEKGIILGMGAIGFGIGAFILSLGGAGAIGKLAGFDGKALKELIGGTIGAFSGTDMLVLGSVFAAAMVIDTSKATKAGVVLGMGAIGAGVAAFTLGIVLADGFAGLGALIGLNGGDLKTLIGNFFGAFTGPAQVTALGVILAAGAVIGKTQSEVAVISGMAALGGGIAAFTVGLLAADAVAAVGQMIKLDGSSLKVLLGNLGEGIGNFVGGIGKGTFEQLQDLDAEKLKELGIGIGGIGLGIAAFSAAKIIGGVGAVVDGLSSFFGAESPIDTIVRLSKDKSIDPVHLAAIGEAIGPLGRGIAAFSGFEVNSGFFTGETDLEKFIVAISRIGDSDVNINTEKIKNLGEALEPLGKGMSGFANVDIDKIVDTSVFGKSTLEVFFGLLSSKAIGVVASKDQMQPVAEGITLMGTAMKTFVGIDMAAIVGNNWTPGKETSMEAFFGSMILATDKIKDPKQLQNVAIGVRALGEAMQTFKGIDGDQINTALESVVGAGGSERAQSLFAGSQQNAMSVSGGTVTITNNYITDNSNKASTTNRISGKEGRRQNDGTFVALSKG